MIQKPSTLAGEIAYHGARRVQAGELPKLKNEKEMSAHTGQQNIDFFEESFQELKARDNADGDVSIHFFKAGPDEDSTPGKVKLGNLEAQYEGDTQNGTRFSVDDQGEVQKLKFHRFSEDQIVAYEATIGPGESVNSSIVIMDRDNPENSVVGSATSDWLLGLS
ncbi:MAG: hypothetical protein KC800_03815 [Candidatus Eremiobacteraeota bacterium]|nr:hypothetical protein [Candidatus Eremiobacteraeota bacterium]